MSNGFKIKEVSEKLIIKNILCMAIKEGIWDSNKFLKYELNKSLIYIKSRNLYYEAGNNQQVDIYEKNGRIGWEILKTFDVNQQDFIPEWKKIKANPIWSVHKNDMLELDTPVQWKSIIKHERCFAKVQKISSGISIVPINCSNTDNMLPDRGLSFFLEHKARKIELTPFGKVKKKHKVLWNGTKTAA